MTSPLLHPSGRAWTAGDVNAFHKLSDVDRDKFSHHHTLGKKPFQAAAGDHGHDEDEIANLVTDLIARVYSPVDSLMLQSGQSTVTFTASQDGTGTASFSPDFGAVPVIVASIIGGSGATGGTIRAGQSATVSSSPINCRATAVLSTTWTVYWIAVGIR